MTKRCRVFFAQAVDGVPAARVLTRFRRVAARCATLGIQLVAPYLAASERPDLETLSKSVACAIAEEDLRLLRGCSAVLADMTRTSRTTVGMFFEIAEARAQGIPVVAVMKSPGLEQRLWIRASTTSVHARWRAALTALAGPDGARASSDGGEVPFPALRPA